HLRFEKKKGKKAPRERGPSLFPGVESYKIEFGDGVGRTAASMLPDTGWRPPTVFPSLRDSAIVSLDLETYDPKLRSRGPGFIRGDAEIIGVAVAAESRSGERFAGYYP